MITYTFYMRPGIVNADGTHTLYLRLIDKKAKYYALKNIRLKPEEWDNKKKIVKRNCPKHAHYNTLLQLYNNKANNIMIDALKQDRTITIDQFIELFFEKEKQKYISFFDFAKSELEKYKEKATYRKVKSQIKNLNEFKKTLSFAEITPIFLQSYEHYLQFDKKPKVLNENSRGSNLKMIARMVNAAIKQSVYKCIPVREMIKIKSGIGNKATVTKDEVDKLFSLLKTNTLRPDYNTSLRAFLFACYTGIRIGDLLDITYENFHKIEYAGQTWTMLEFIQNKTKNLVKIPLIDKAYQIYIEFPSAGKKIFNNYSQKKLNEDLKIIIKIAKIQKKLSFSSSRCSCATILADEGCPDHIIAAILGPKSVNTTRKYYIKTSDESLIKAMKKHYEKKKG